MGEQHGHVPETDGKAPGSGPKPADGSLKGGPVEGVPTIPEDQRVAEREDGAQRREHDAKK